MSPTRHVPCLPIACTPRAAGLATLFGALLAGCTDEPQPTGPAAPRDLRPSMAAVASAVVFSSR
jgi:type IV pilus biogenesis protein CpaD/CtpE